MKYCLVVISIFLSFFSFAQNQDNIWYFGKFAGLDFNGGSPVVLTGGMTNIDEGTASISDSSGNLLFYTDGVTVFNKNHIPMPNGSGLFGQSSTTQAALIVEKPSSPNRFYVFTNDSGNGGVYNGISYSEVDMTLDGGYGDLIAKNITILPNCSEKLCAILHSNDTDSWVISHSNGSNNYYAFLVTSSGVNASPIISTTGSNELYRIGYLKPSIDGTELSSIISSLGIELLSFNRTSGNINYKFALPSNLRIYSTEYSPDGTKLYLGIELGLGITNPGTIYQYDLSLLDSVSILNSFTLVGSASFTVGTPTGAVGALRLAPDGKIYVARGNSGTLGVINNPNDLGTLCNYVDTAILLGTGNSWYGLPNDLARGRGFSTAIDDLTDCADYLLYPNPFNSVVTLSGIESGNQIEVFNLLGEKIFSISIEDNQKEANLDFSSLSKGMYLIQVQTLNGVVSKKIIKK